MFASQNLQVEETITDGLLQIRMKMMRCISFPPKIERVIKQPRKAYQTPDGNNFNIDIELKTCVHGYLSWSKRQPASLIIFGVQLACLRNHGTIKRMRLQVDFEDMHGNTPSANPGVISHAPFEFERQNVSEINIEETRGAQSNVSATINLVGGNHGVTHSRVEKYKELYFGKSAAATLVNDKGVHSGVWWDVKQSTNPHAKDDAGIEPNYRFAVLLTRKNDSDFQARLCLEVNAGWRHRVENNFSQKVTGAGKKPNLTFSPATLHYEGNCTGINRKRLGRFKSCAELQKVTHSIR
jgi:hypothetical protein